MSETDGQMLERLGTDGAKWAFEFRAIALRHGYSAIDEGWLIGWFANAIEQGRTAGAAPLAAENATLRTERDEAQAAWKLRCDLHDKDRAERDAATARAATLAEEVEKLREALKLGLQIRGMLDAHCANLGEGLEADDQSMVDGWTDEIAAALAPAATAPRDAAGGAA